MFPSLGDRIDRNPKEIFQSSIKLPRLGLSSVKALHPTMEINSTCGKLWQDLKREYLTTLITREFHVHCCKDTMNSRQNSELETDDAPANMRESFSLVQNILFIGYTNVPPAH